MLDQDVVPAGYQLVRKTVDKLVAGDVVSWAAKEFPYFHTVDHWGTYTDGVKGLMIRFSTMRQLERGTVYDWHNVKPSTRIWVLDKVDDAG
jgi:hypothetical protein